MPATDYLGSAAVPLASLGRSIMSMRREAAEEPSGGVCQDEVEAFQRHVAEALTDLAASRDDLLSLSWLHKLLEVFLICFEEFRAVFSGGAAPPAARAPPLDRMAADFFEREVRALDVCNAVRDGAGQLRRWRRHLDIVLAAVGDTQSPLGEGRLRRARKALADLALATLDDGQDTPDGSALIRRLRSFGNDDRQVHTGGGTGHVRSQSWSVSRSWSAARQLQAMGSGLAAPRGHEVVATRGFAVPVYAMGQVLVFVMWALVAAIPCQDRGLQTHFSIPRSFPWAAPILSLHERILEESKKKEKKHANGLLKELHQMEGSARRLMELIDNIQLPISEEKEMEIRQTAKELKEVRDALKDGLDPMELQLREVFHRIVRSRIEGLRGLGKKASLA